MTGRAPGRIHVFIRGRVQGVGFRWYVMDVAREAGDGVTGWVRNLRDGSVEVVAEGPGPALDRLVEACASGPSGSRVTGTTLDREPATGDLPPFEIRPTF